MGKTWRVVGSRPFILFSVILMLKVYLAWFVVFEKTPPLSPFVTEIPFIWIVFILIETFATKRKMLYYLLSNLLLTFILFSVMMYYTYYGVIPTFRALEQANQTTAVSNSVISLLKPYFLFIFTDIVIFSFLFFRKRKTPVWQSLNLRREKRGLLIGLFTISVVICLMNILPNRASMNERVKAGEMGILNYEAYAFLADEDTELIDKSEITQAAVNRLKGIDTPANPKYEGIAKGKNLIIIQMESFQNFLINLKVDGTEITPNLNKLVNGNFYFPRFYQQVGQGNTSDAEFVVNTSFYVPPTGAATMRYVDKVLPSLPRLMSAEGYDTATFHTNVVDFWNRGELYSSLGWDRYYDAEFFGREDPVFFGASDEVLYSKTADELKRMNDSGKPFYSQVLAMSGHHPFTIPEKKIRMTVPERYQDTLVGDYLEAQNYADYALGQFIAELKANGVWEDSIVVIYGDHLGLPIYSLSDEEKDLMAEIYQREYGYTDMINIPLVIASEGSGGVTYPAVFRQLAGQADVLPTIANLMGIPLDGQLHFGQDILNQSYNLLPQRYYLPSGSLLTGDSLFMPGVGYQDGQRYPLSGKAGDESVVFNFEYENALKLLKLSNSYLLQLPDKEKSEKNK
ncbi:sulfatase [Paenibacillus darwinianus]|uniref:Sulfatase n=1 Tax=Paenibacillus darwinianus TaxID=1380763 RepID=A0A9W5RZG9_9BACL|nr:LTA synthase family protein [Paenibacillus darwinianus]EXX85927.1 sulfatase [Paenibacillus darwinianus]EXX86854.1 sulfatase [Paenibacillus darwinianus]EXX88025.1 sulfatase [Paenibacillus darwinianus]